MWPEQPKYPVVSIVTPSYNQGRYLAETIESVIRQQGDFYLDYIIIDGGSRDNSVDVIKHYQQLISSTGWKAGCPGIRYRWISERDEGQTDAIQKGLTMATGEILAWINSDDTYLPDAIQTACRTLADNPGCSALYGKCHYIDENSDPVGDYPTEPYSMKRLASFNFIAQPSVFFLKSILTEVGYPDKTLHYAMDFDLWIRIARKNDFLYLDQFLSNYRLHPDSKTVGAHHAFETARECMIISEKYYAWTPLNRVYVYSFHKVSMFVPSFLSFRFLTIPLALIFACLKYLVINRSVKMDDLRMLSFRNIVKALRSHI